MACTAYLTATPRRPQPAGMYLPTWGCCDTWDLQRLMLQRFLEAADMAERVDLFKRYETPHHVRYLPYFELQNGRISSVPDQPLQAIDETDGVEVDPAAAFVLCDLDGMPLGSWWHPQERRPLAKYTERVDTYQLNPYERFALLASYAVRPPGYSDSVQVFKRLQADFFPDGVNEPDYEWGTFCLWDRTSNPIQQDPGSFQREQAMERYVDRVTKLVSYGWEFIAESDPTQYPRHPRHPCVSECHRLPRNSGNGS